MAKSYKEKLSDKRWQLKKSKIFERDKYKCQSPNCKSDDTVQIQVHHLEYLGNLDPWEYPDDMLVTLCKFCHNKETGRVELENSLATTLRMNGFLYADILAMSSKINTDPSFKKLLLKILREFQNG